MTKKLFSIVICLVLVGCDGISDLTLKIEPKKLDTLKSLEPIEVKRANSVSIFDIRCQNRNKIGSTGYYLTSKGTNLNDKKAIWKCAVEMEFMNCPSMTLISVNKEVVATKIDGSQSDYSKSDVEKCILKAIEVAPTESRPTSESAANEESWG